MLKLLKATAEEIRADEGLRTLAKEREKRVEVYQGRMNWYRSLPAPKARKLAEEWTQLVEGWSTVENSLGDFFKAHGFKPSILDYPPGVRVELNDLMVRRAELNEKLLARLQAYVRRHPKKDAPPGAIAPSRSPGAMERANGLTFLPMSAGDFASD